MNKFVIMENKQIIFLDDCLEGVDRYNHVGLAIKKFLLAEKQGHELIRRMLNSKGKLENVSFRLKNTPNIHFDLFYSCLAIDANKVDKSYWAIELRPHINVEFYFASQPEEITEETYNYSFLVEFNPKVPTENGSYKTVIREYEIEN